MSDNQPPERGKPELTGMSEEEEVDSLRNVLTRFERRALEAWAMGDDLDIEEFNTRAQRVRDELDARGVPHRPPQAESGETRNEVDQRPTPSPTDRPADQ